MSESDWIILGFCGFGIVSLFSVWLAVLANVRLDDIDTWMRSQERGGIP
jgi:hypothetical protein